MTVLLSRVPDYTTNLTTLEVAVVLELRQWSRMPEVVMPEIVVWLCPSWGGEAGCLR